MEYEGIIYRYKSPSGKYYIGQTVDETRRRRDFLGKKKVYAGPKIDNARNKYGPDNFEYTVLMKITSDSEEELHKYLDILEIGFTRMYKSYENGYNCTIGGGGGRSGYNLPEETKEKIRKKLIGHEPSNKGIPMSEEQKKKLSESKKGQQTWKGKHHTEETKQKLREINKGQIPPNKGIPMSEEQKKKISESKKRSIPWNKGVKTGIQAWNKGKTWSEEAKKKMSDSHKGKPAPNKGIHMSEEQKMKMIEDRKGRHRVYNPDGTYRMVK